MFKVLSDFFNNHRLSRKPITREEREKFVKKSKEFSLFKVYFKKVEFKFFKNYFIIFLRQIHKWNQHHFEESKRIELEAEMMKAATLLPTNLMLEALDVADELYENRAYYDQATNIEYIEYEDTFLYAHQILRIYPDDYHQLLKTGINSSVYFNEITSAGKEAGEMDEEIDTLNLDSGMDEGIKI